MKSTLSLLSEILADPIVLGGEDTAFLPKRFEKDSFGNRFLYLPSKNKNAKTLLVDAHLDMIGVTVRSVEKDGFLSVSPCGGFDTNILPGTLFVFGKKEPIYAICTSLPPHLKNIEKNSSAGFSTLYLDTGIRQGLSDRIKLGDLGRFVGEPQAMGKDLVVSCGLDNAASVAAVLLSLTETVESNFHRLIVLSTGEETGHSGIRSFLQEHPVDLALVVDVGFGSIDNIASDRCIKVGKGPSISFSDTTNASLNQSILDTANKLSLPLQTLTETGRTGSNVDAIRMMQGGIPTALISIPLWNMHTSSEIVSIKDLKSCAALLKAIYTDLDFGGCR